MRSLLFLVGLSSVALSSVIKTRHDDSYSECYADRGLEQKDLEEAGRFLGDTLASAGGLPMLTNECAYKRHNTTIVSLCNGSARNRTVNQGEVQRGIAQLFKDCNQLGAFTGVHVVNNLTFAAYGIYGGINVRPPAGQNPPDTPGSVKRSGKGSWLEFFGKGPIDTRDDSGGDCPVGFYGTVRTDCARPEGITLNDDGSCGPIKPNQNECQVFCEMKRTGLLGPETKAPGQAGETQAPGGVLQLEEGKESSVSQGFSAGLEGVIKEIFGVGVTYEWSHGTAKTISIQRQFQDVDKTQHTRWVYFPKLIESCGTISKRKYEIVPVGKGGTVPTCTGEVETLEDKCSLSPFLKDGDAQAFWALRYEWPDGVMKPIEEQHVSYKSLCNTPDPDGDGQDECNGANLPDHPERR